MKIGDVELQHKHKGLTVAYQGPPQDKGTISSWNKRFVFVDYGTGSKATSPSDLTWVSNPHALYTADNGHLSPNY